MTLIELEDELKKLEYEQGNEIEIIKNKFFDKIKKVEDDYINVIKKHNIDDVISCKGYETYLYKIESIGLSNFNNKYEIFYRTRSCGNEYNYPLHIAERNVIDKNEYISTY